MFRFSVRIGVLFRFSVRIGVLFRLSVRRGVLYTISVFVCLVIDRYLFIVGCSGGVKCMVFRGGVFWFGWCIGVVFRFSGLME